MTMIAAIRKLRNVLPKMLLRDVNVRALDGPFQLGPMAFDAVGVMNTVHPFIFGVVDGAVRVAHRAKVLIADPFVCADCRAARNVALNRPLQDICLAVRDRASNQTSIAFKHSEKLGLVRVHVGMALHLSADQRFVNFDVARERAFAVCVGIRHQLAKLMRHAPRRFVGAADLAFQFLSRNAVTRGSHQVHGEKPVSQLRAGLVKDRARARVDVMPALLAGKGFALVHGVKLGLSNTTAGAGNLGAAVLDIHERQKAGRVIRELGLELLECVFHGFNPRLCEGYAR